MKNMIVRVAAVLLLATGGTASAAIVDVEVRGSDAIFLAGWQGSFVIPPASSPWNAASGTPVWLIRHGGPTPEEIQETFPPFVNVAAGDLVRVLDPAVGGVSFFNGIGGTVYGPGGGPGNGTLNSLGGISGYSGPYGPLVGVFLGAGAPTGAPPATINYNDAAQLAQLSRTPVLGQVFYIGTGQVGSAFREFTAPTGATRLFFGIPDGFSFVGAPGAYDDNDGAYRIRVGVNEIPTRVPEPATLALFSLALLGVVGFARRRARARR
jgi:hypothetical protein